ncbi:MAG TPA: DUF2064 domain-containing protein [Syntrophomonadaceae bacterium]|nr:DUF2064 domain-containing protein [Syntrophomonadaceae bacterium]
MRNAVVVFTKVPRAGDTKTRLTTERGGIFTREQARDFYEACLLDVIDSCIVSQCADVYICLNAGGNGDYFKQLMSKLPKPRFIKKIFTDKGGTFDQAMQYAFDYILRRGHKDRLADNVLLIGGDVIGLQPRVIKDSMSKLHALAGSSGGLSLASSTFGKGEHIGAAIVASADQEGGFNIIGHTCTTPFSIAGIFYNQDYLTAMDVLVNKACERKIPFGMVEMAPDIDIPADLTGLIPGLRAMQISARYDDNVFPPLRTLFFLEKNGLCNSALPFTFKTA